MSSIWLANDLKDRTAHIVALTLGYRFKLLGGGVPLPVRASAAGPLRRPGPGWGNASPDSRPMWPDLDPDVLSSPGVRRTRSLASGMHP